jgi:hypothetical protein
VQVQPILRTYIGILQLRTNRRDVGIGQAHGFKVRETPVGLAQFGAQGDRVLQRDDGLLAPPGNPQVLAIVEPQPRLFRMLGEDAFQSFDRPIESADKSKTGREQRRKFRIVWRVGEQTLELNDRLASFVLLKEDEGIIMPRADKTRGELEAAGEQFLGVFVVTEARRGFSIMRIATTSFGAVAR